jgi:enhancing lycopene biosynthesis protein 2
MNKPVFAVLLTGCGPFDGTDPHIAVLSLLNIDKFGADYMCISPDILQDQVINHIDNSNSKEKRNMLAESARIARGKIKSFNEISINDFDGLIIPGGGGACQNLVNCCVQKADCDVIPEIKDMILQFVFANKPIVALCTGVKVLAKSLEKTGINPKITVGNGIDSGEKNYNDIVTYVEKSGAMVEVKSAGDITVDEKNKIISAPCYLTESTIYEINIGIEKAIKRLLRWV